ncbi:unnamed protein product [Rotaria magnacalcarata]|nr:unnamed protein product [Rotaria magnacalcarata]
MYADWPDYVASNPKRVHKDILRKRSLISPMHLKTVQLEDKLLLNELQSIQRISNLPTLVSYAERSSYKESKSIDGDNLQRTTSPTDEYQRSADLFHMTREPPMMHSNHAEQSLSHQTYSTKHSALENKTQNGQSMKNSVNFNFGPKPQASISVQLRQSAKTRQQALATSNDYQSPSLQSMSSLKRAAPITGNTPRRAYQIQPLPYPSTPPSTETHITNGLQEKSKTNSSCSVKRPSLRSTNSSRATVHMLKTKNDRAREKQHIDLKTALVKPHRQHALRDSALEESIPSSLDKMRKLGGSITAFEKNLDYNYNRQLNQFRIDLKQC